MKRIVYVLLFVTIFMTFSSCGESKSHRVSSLYESVGVEDEENSETKEAPKKSEMFYQGLLDEFCRRFYSDCFDRTYHSNSLIVDDIGVIQGNWDNGNIISWDMLVKGRHSFKARVRNHNDSPFVAYVYDLGNNKYKVTFTIKRYDIFGDQMSDDEEATRTITYSE